MIKCYIHIEKDKHYVMKDGLKDFANDEALIKEIAGISSWLNYIFNDYFINYTIKKELDETTEKYVYYASIQINEKSVPEDDDSIENS